MLFVLLGLAAGAAVAFGKLPVLEPAAGAVADGIVGAGVQAIDGSLGAFGADLDAPLAVVLRACVVALMPSIAAGVLMGTARGTRLVRRLGGAAVAVAAVYVAVTQPAPYGIVGAALLLLVGLAVAFLVTNAVAVVAAGLSGLLAATQIRLFFAQETNRFTETAEILATTAGVGDASWWRLALVAASLTLAASVFWHALHD